MYASGRPRKIYDSDFLLQVLRDHRNMSLTQLAKKHNCSVSTIQRYLRMAKALPEAKDILDAAAADAERCNG